MKVVKNYIWSILFATALAIAALFWYGLKNYQAQKHDYEIIDTVNKMRAIDIALDHFIEKKISYENFDLTVEHIKCFEAYLDGLSKGDMLDTSNPSISKLLGNLKLQMENKIALIEEYKSLSSVVNNSMTFMYDLSSNFNASYDTSEEKAFHSILRPMNDIIFELSKVSVDKKIDYELMGSALNDIYMTKIKDAKIVELVERFGTHCIIIMTNTAGMDELLKQNSSQQLKLSINDFEKVLIADFGRKHKNAQAVTAVLFACIIALLALLAFLYKKEQNISMQLSMLNDTLKQKIAEEVDKSRQKDLLVSKQASLAAMGEMIGNIAHQWRQPLNVVALIVQDMKEAFEYGDLTRDYLDKNIDTAMKNLLFMSSTIDDFRNFFKPDKQAVAFDPCSALVDAISLVSATLKNKDILVQLQQCELQDEIFGYPNELKQAIMIILSNAKDALIETKTPDPQIWICTVKQDDSIVIQIADNAGGVPEHLQDRIFEPYFTTKDQGQGIGIGLYTAKIIIEQNMHGVLSVHNDEKGAVFSIKLKVV